METIDVLTSRCFVCGTEGMVKDIPLEQYEAWTTTQPRPFIQDVFPNMSAGDREQLLTGTHSACFDMMFPEEDDEDEPHDNPF